MSRPGRRPARTCVGCRREAGKESLFRLVRGADGAIRLDAGGRAPGRGAYLHADGACSEEARRRRALERALGGQTGEGLWRELAGAASEGRRG